MHLIASFVFVENYVVMNNDIYYGFFLNKIMRKAFFLDCGKQGKKYWFDMH